MAGQIDVPMTSSETAVDCLRAAMDAATASRMSVTASLAEEFFGSTLAQSYAHRVASMAAAVSLAPDHASAVRNAAAHIYALLPGAVHDAVPADADLPSASQPLPRSSAFTSTASTQVKYQLLVTTGLVVSRSSASVRSCAPSNGVTAVASTAAANSTTICSASATHSGASGGSGPQLHLFCGLGGKPPITLPASETLIVRAPIRADALAAMLSEALAAPVSSAGLAAAACARSPGVACSGTTRTGMLGTASVAQQQHSQQQKLLALRCPEEELPTSQPCAELAAMEAAGVRAPHGSVVLVSLPLPSIMCAVVAYVCAVPAVGVGDDAEGPARASPPPASRARQHLAQLSEAKLNAILQHVSSAVEVLAGALEQRMVSSCTLSPARLGNRVPCTVDVTADTSGLVTVSFAGTDGEDSNGFWGSASGPILSGESIPTSHFNAVSGIHGASPSVSPLAGGFSFGRSGEVRAPGCAKAIASAGPAGATSARPHTTDSTVASRTTAVELLAASTTETAVEDDGDGSSGLFESAMASTVADVDTSSTVDEAKECTMLSTTAPVGAAGDCTLDEVPSPAPLKLQQSQQVGRPSPGVTPAARPAQEAEASVTSCTSAAAVSSSAAAEAGPLYLKQPSVGNRGSLNLPPLNDTDMSQDTAVEAEAAAARVAAATTAAAVSPSSASTTAASSSIGGSCASGVVSTINALACGKVEHGRDSGGRCMPAGSCEPSGDTGTPGPGQPTVVKFATKGPAPVLLTRSLQPPSGWSAASRDGGDGGTVVSLAPPAAVVAAVAMAQHGGGASSSRPSAEAVRMAQGLGQARGSAEDLILAARGFAGPGSAAGGGASGSSGDQVVLAMIRNRSKDWSDQAGEPEGCDSRAPVLGLAAPHPRHRSIKVLSLDKAAQQLQRSSGSSLAMVMQPTLPPPPARGLLLQEQQQPQQQGPVPGNASQQASAALQDGAQPTAQAGAATTAATATTTAPPPPPYQPYMPRRLNRMYLLPAALATAGAGVAMASGSIPINPVGVAATVTRIAGPFGAVAAPGLSAMATAVAAPVPLQPIHLNAKPIDMNGGSQSARVVAAPLDMRRTAPAAQSGLAPDGAECPNAVPPAVPLDAARRPSTPEMPGPPAFELGSTPLPHFRKPVLVQSSTQSAPRFLPPSATVAAAAAAMAAARATGVGAGAESPAASGNSQKNRQLSDYAIPEDAPLEYTVSETVQMMRMLAQARGVHLSSRMRRVRVTAKIQSAHPEALPADLPSQLAKAALLAPHCGAGAGAGGGGLFGGSAGHGAAGGGTWVLTGVAARRGCIELVFDVVHVRGSGGVFESQLHPEAAGRRLASMASSRRASSPQLYGQLQAHAAAAGAGAARSAGSGTYVRFSQQAQAQGQASPAASPSNGVLGYRRWHGAGAHSMAEPLGLLDDADGDATSLPAERVLGGIGLAKPQGSAAAAAAAGEQLWLRNVCGLRPEAVAEVLQDCGLLSGGSDPLVDVQIGHTASGGATLAWHEATGQWVATSGGGSTPVMAAGPLEAPTLWLPCSVAVLARGARVLQDIRLVSTAGGCGGSGLGGSSVIDEVTVRSASGFLPVRVAAGLRMHATGAGSGSSVSPLPLLLEDDPVVEALTEGACCWRLMDVGGALPRSGGLLLVECRRSVASAAAGGAAAASGTAPSRSPASLIDPVPTAPGTVPPPAVVTSAPVPLLVLPEQNIAAATELQRLRVYIARLLLGSEDVLRATLPTDSIAPVSAAAGAARAEAAAQVEMACQQFLMDLGALVDAAASAGAAAKVAAAAAVTMPASAGPSSLGTSGPGPLSCPQTGISNYRCSGGGGGSGSGSTAGAAAATSRQPPHSFSEAQSASHSKRPQLLELQVSPVCTTDVLSSMPSCSSPLTMLGGCVPGRGSELAGAWASEGGRGVGDSNSIPNDPAACSFASDMTGLMRVRCVSGSSGGAAAAPGDGVTDFGEHLVDLACTLLAGCCAAGMQHTALLVLRTACGELALATPEMLLAEAGANPQASLELLSAYTAQTSRKGTSAPPAVAVAAACTAGAAATQAGEPALVGKAAAGHAVGLGRLPRSETEWSSTDGHAGPNSTHSRSHSLAVMLVGQRSSATSPLTLQERGELDSPSADFGCWAQADHSAESEAQELELGQGREPQEPMDAAPCAGAGPGAAAEVTDAEAAAAWRRAAEAALAARGSSPRRPPAPRALAVGVEILHQGSSGDLLPTWGTSAAGTPDACTRTCSRSRLGSHLLGSLDVVAATADAPEAQHAGHGMAQSSPLARSSSPVLGQAATAVVAAYSSTRTATAPVLVRSSTPTSLTPLPPRHGLALSRAASGSSVISRRTLRSEGSDLMSARSSGAGGSADPVPTSSSGEEIDVEDDEEGDAVEGAHGCRGAAAVAAADLVGPAAVGGGHDDGLAVGGAAAAAAAATAVQPLRGGGIWSMRFSDPAVEADYMQFVATRTCSMMWSYFLCNIFISAVSCTRAWVEDGMEGCLALLVFSGLQGCIMGWYCIACGARDARAMVTAAVSCKAVRLAGDLLMGTRLLKVPSLMEPMAVRGVEVLTEALMRPIAERVPFDSFCLMALLEFPCVWLLYRHFHAIFPDYWLRSCPLFRTLVFAMLSGMTNALAELYWRREYRRWSRGCMTAAGGGATGGITGLGARRVAGGAAEEGTALGKSFGKEE